MARPRAPAFAAVAHLRRVYGPHAALMGEHALLRFGAYAQARAARWGIEEARDVVAYAAAMAILGSHFDEDPLFEELSAPLRGDEPAEARARTLHAGVLDFAARASGADEVALRAALRRIRAHAFLAPPRDPSDAAIVALVEELYPERSAMTARSALAGLGPRARAAAARHGLQEEGRAPPVLAVLLFMLGAGFDVDPQYPWAGEALLPTGEGSEEPLLRTSRLYAASMVHLEKLMSAAGVARAV